MKLLPLLSYSVNVLLVAYVSFSFALSPIKPASKPEADPRAKSPPQGQLAAAPRITVAGKESDLQECRAIIEELRRGGASASLLYAVAEAFLGERDRSALNAIHRPSGIPRWRSKNHSLSSEDRTQISAIKQTREHDMIQILGADYLAALAERAPPGALPPEKRLAIRDVERDYMEITHNLGIRLRAAERETLDRNFEKDLAVVLSPSELSEYLAYESRLASRLQSYLIGLELDDATYRKIYDAIAASPIRQLKEGSSAHRLAIARLVGEVGGSEFALHVAAKQDQTFRDIAALYGDEKFGPDAIWKNYERFVSFHDELANLQKAPPTEGSATLRSMANQTYSELTRGLSDAARARFDKTNTGSFLIRAMNTKSI